MCKIRNNQVNNEKEQDVLTPMYNLIELSDNYAKKIRKRMTAPLTWSQQCHKRSESFKSKSRIKRRGPAAGNTNDV